MGAKLKLSVAAVTAALVALNGVAVLRTQIPDLGDGWFQTAAAAEAGHTSGGHTSGGGSDKGGGHTSGGGSDKGGGHTSGGGSDKGGGHTSGGGSDKGGGHTSGGGSDKGGGHADKGGGHSGGESGKGGTEEKGHGLKKGHEGHASGQHGPTEHDMGGRRFAGGAGIIGNSQIPEGVGRYGSGAPSDQGRTRYWGGWTLPEDVDNPANVATLDVIPLGGGAGSSVNVRTTLQSAARCDDVGGGMPMNQRVSGANLNRIASARTILDSGSAPAESATSPYLLANFQEELEKATPDLTLAGLYVGLIAKGPVTPAKVKQVCTRLCVKVSDGQAAEIAKAAELQRVATR